MSSSESSTDVTATTDTTSYNIVGNYYFNRAFNIGGRLASISSDSASTDGTEYALLVGYFFSENFQVIGSYTEFDSEAGGTSDTDVLIVQANYRF